MDTNTEVKRLFIGLPLPEHFSDELFEFQLLYENMQGIRWIPKNNLHITTCFIGDVEIEKVTEINSKLKIIQKKYEAFFLDFDKLCYAPKGKKAYMVWAKFFCNELFNKLSNDIKEQILQEKSNNKNFIPHITLARFKKIDKSIINFDYPVENQHVEIKKMVLYESVLKRTGAEYTVLETYNFLK
ncbi:MAG: RNA 2',3'-cyclic phosphodiesterase [Bacteroidales bacterium]|nr:RNA 2',3'-cyclic phosphodiesterase [Bacteroidales bacterium]